MKDIFMGSKAREIVGVDVKKIVQLLNKAFADEWLAYYQYWIGAEIVKGHMKDSVIAELTQHAGDELRHAQMLSKRIIQLGGTPILEPKEWYSLTNCGYMAPTDPHVKAVLQQNIKGEQCAIDVYNKLVHDTKEKDILTYNMVAEILSDEVEHEEDLQTLLEDLSIGK
jgi:bacterioferritin